MLERSASRHHGARTHNDPLGNMVPSRYATPEELVGLCSVLAEFDGTSVEFIPTLGAFEDWVVKLMTDMFDGGSQSAQLERDERHGSITEGKPCQTHRR